ncbi:MAG: hypothetical protein ACR2NH_06645 [Solirubrobacteraceae bacterium]
MFQSIYVGHGVAKVLPHSFELVTGFLQFTLKAFNRSPSLGHLRGEPVSILRGSLGRLPYLNRPGGGQELASHRPHDH